MVCITRGFAVLAVLALGSCASRPTVSEPIRSTAERIDWAAAKTVTVKMTDFDFTPGLLSLQSGQPLRLILENDGSGRHDFSAPAFFATASFRPGGAAPANGKIALVKDTTAEIDLVPETSGTYPLECTEFLHKMFGMTGTITVSDAR